MSTQAIQPQQNPIPLDLRKELPDYWIPWGISDRIFGEMKSQGSCPYKKVQVLPTDPEWRFVWKYFYHDKPNRYGIKRIFCVHERHQQQTFEVNLSSIEREAETFKPTWNQEPRAMQRARAIERWKSATDLFSPFNTRESDGRRRNWKETKLLPLWHGSGAQICDSIAKSGFVYFGKTSIGGKSSGDPTSTDEGFFGSGIYFTNSARYASDIYSSGHILMAWVSMREPFPVVGDPSQTDMKVLKGKGAYKHYNAHYVPVASQNPSDPYEAIYYPTKEGASPHCDEIVVFHKSQTVPRFWVELEVEVPYLMQPSEVPQFVNELIPHLMKMLENSQVDRDQKLRNYLSSELAFLLKLKEDDYLDDHGDKYETLYGHLTQLIDVQGKVNRQISRIITASISSTVSTHSSSSTSISHQFQQMQLSQQNSPQVLSYPHIPSFQNSQPQSHYSGPPVPHVAQNSSPSVTPFTSSSIPQTIPVYPSQPVKMTIPEIAFGKAKWEKYFGDVGVEPPIPKDIIEVLKSPCPYWSGKRVEETHLLVLIPESVNGRPFTIGTLGEMIKSPQKEGYSTKYYNYDNTAVKELKDQGISSSYWALITKNVLPNSRSKTYAEQQALIKGPYAVPGALEIATGILMHHVQTGERLYSDSPDTYTRCQEKLSSGYRVVVGSFGSSGLGVDDDYGDADPRLDGYGLGGVRKF